MTRARVNKSSRPKAIQISLDRLHTLLDYNPETGVFTWRSTRNNKTKAGDVAGRYYATTDSYQIAVDRTAYHGNRLAWFYQTGDDLTGWEIVFKDGDHSNIRFANLVKVKESPRSLTIDNRRDSNPLGKGIVKTKGKFQARVYENSRTTVVGTFPTQSVAITARDEYLANRKPRQ